jgi:hypothetical protein|tara:strand:+ start:884 stop:1030 length:147 start_codon:yes stop_codon:yes gene_type:complete
MPVPIWVTLAAVKAVGVGAYYIHRKIVTSKQSKADAPNGEGKPKEDKD